MSTKGTITSSASPSVLHIAETIEYRIQSGEYPEGRWLPSERDISMEFGVSRNVVKSVVKELEIRNLISCSSRCRPIVNRVNETTNNSPKLRTRRKTVGLWIWPLSGYAPTASIVNGINSGLDHDAYRLIVTGPTEPSWDAAMRSECQFLLRMASDEDITGIILWCLGGSASLPALNTIKEAGIPLVFIDRRPPKSFDADYVGVDNIYSSEVVVNHLIKQGHRRIAHISNLDTASTVKERREGYRLALAKQGIPYSQELDLKLYSESTDHTDVEVNLMLDGLLGMATPPTAIFAVNDIIAMRMRRVLTSRGIRIPQEMALAGFDGVETETHTAATLTTACQPFERIGSHAARLLMQRVQGMLPEASQHHVLEAPLLIRSST